MASSQRTVRIDASTFFLQDFPYCAIDRRIGKLRGMAKQKAFKITTIARAKASASKDRLDRSAEKKKTSHEAASILRRALSVRCPTCGAAPREECKLAVGSPRTKPHRDRRSTAKD